MQFEWDEAKASANLTKHGVAFEAIDRLVWATAAVFSDVRRDYGEDRIIVMGEIDQRLHVAVTARRDKTSRLISLRKANRREISAWTKLLAKSESDRR